MKAVIVTGDRHAGFATWNRIIRYALTGSADVVLDGGATGIDELARHQAEYLDLTTVTVPAKWDRDGKAAGPIRNKAMLTILTTLGNHAYDISVLAFHDNLAESKGTGHMVRIAKEAGVRVRHFTSDGLEH